MKRSLCPFYSATLWLVTVSALTSVAATPPADAYRPQPPDYTRKEFPLNTRSFRISNVFWEKTGTRGGVSKTPPSNMLHTDQDRADASGWRPGLFWLAEYGNPVAERHRFEPIYDVAYAKEVAISMKTDQLVNDRSKNFASAADARREATRLVEEGMNYAREECLRRWDLPEIRNRWEYRRWREHCERILLGDQPIFSSVIGSLTPQMRACYNRQEQHIFAFINEFVGSRLHSEALKKNIKLQEHINLKTVWTSGLKNSTSKKADLINGTLIIVPQSVNSGASCKVASKEEIWKAVKRVLEPAIAGKPHPDAGLPAGPELCRLYRINDKNARGDMLMGSPVYESHEAYAAHIVMNCYKVYEQYFKLHPDKYASFYYYYYKPYVEPYLRKKGRDPYYRPTEKGGSTRSSH